MIREVPELAVTHVAQDVGVLAGIELDGGIADPDAYAVRALLDAKGLRPPVARYAPHVEARDDAFAAAVRVHRREVAEDSAPDVHALRTHAQGLADLDRAVGAHTDVALPAQDAFVGAYVGRYEQEGEAQRHDRAQDPPETCSPHHATFADSNSKYSAGTKPNSRAGITSGNVATRVFRLFTAPL